MPARVLRLDERVEIRRGLDRAEPVRVMADRLSRHRSTIHAEIDRNGGRDRYCPAAAQDRADRNLKRPKVPKLVADPALAAHVTERLVAQDSPMTISIELARGVWGVTGSISHECVYQAIYRRGRGLEPGLGEGLHLRRRRRKKRSERAVNSHSLGFYCSIHDRPPIALERTEVGHLEGDLIIGAANRSALITLFDRAARKCWLAPLPNKTADATYLALTKTLARIPEHLRRTLAWDQGAEIAGHREITLTSGIHIYIADPKAPWQRPTNENGNALVRRYVGKGTDLNAYTPNDLQAIEHRINTIPRRTLGWHTANDIYNAAVALTD